MKPQEIRFTQSSISSKFREGRTLKDVINDVLNGKKRVADFPAIRVVQMHGKWWSLDNRRLYVFKQLQSLGKCNQVNVEVVSMNDPNIRAEWGKKFTTKNDGQSVRIRDARRNLVTDSGRLKMLGGARLVAEVGDTDDGDYFSDDDDYEM